MWFYLIDVTAKFGKEMFIGVDDLSKPTVHEPTEDDKLAQKIRSELRLLGFEKNLEKQNRTVWSNLSLLGSLISLFLWGAVILHLWGFFQIVPVPVEEPGQAVSVSVADVIGVLVPALLTVVAFFVGATGLRRLQLYDNEFREFRRERRQDSERFQAEAERRFEGISSRVEDATTATISEVIKKREDAINRNLSEVRLSTEQLEDRLKGIESQFGWIFSSDQRELMTEGAISSVGELHKVITDLFQKNKSGEAKALVEKYFPEDGHTSLRGTADDFFNTGTQLAQADLEPMAYRVLNQGLSIFPNNPDLLATSLKHAADAGFQERAEELYKVVQELPPEQRNWRIWVFVGDYLEETMEADDVIRYYRDYVERYFSPGGERLTAWPMDAPSERVFSKLANYLFARSRMREAESVARLAMKHIARTPQCSSVLSRIYLEEGDFDACIQFAEKALLDDRRDQTNVSSATSLMNIALAKDSLAFSDISREPKELSEAIKSAFEAYGAVLRSLQKPAVYPITINMQINSLIAKAESRGMKREHIVSLMPIEVASLMGMEANSGRVNGSEQSTAVTSVELLRALVPTLKQLAEVPGELRSQQISQLSASIRERSLGGEVRAFLEDLLEKIADDEDQAAFVHIVRQVLSQI